MQVCVVLPFREQWSSPCILFHHMSQRCEIDRCRGEQDGQRHRRQQAYKAGGRVSMGAVIGNVARNDR